MQSHTNNAAIPKENTYVKNRERTTTKNLVEIALFTAVIAILSQIAIPMPSGLPATLQTFAIALTGVVLGRKCALESTVVYILLGAVGVPVFAELSGGIQVLLNYSGGFIWGFLVMSYLCGIGAGMKHRYVGIFVGMAGLIICHFFGVMQFMFVMGRGFAESFFLASAPYLLKDIISVLAAFAVGIQIRGRLKKAGLL